MNDFSLSSYRRLHRRMGHAYPCETRSFLWCHSETTGPHGKFCEYDSDNESGDRLPVRTGHSPDREMHLPTPEALS
jgi:hypothetical protein